MTWSEILSAVRHALATIREHKMRSLLTVLGVIIGTGTVIAVGSIITAWMGPWSMYAQHGTGRRDSSTSQYRVSVGKNRPRRACPQAARVAGRDCDPGPLPVDRGRVPLPVPSRFLTRGAVDRVPLQGERRLTISIRGHG